MLFTRQQRQLYWSTLIQEWEDSELTQSVFCEQKNVKLGTFRKWRQRIKKKNERGQEKHQAQERNFIEAKLINPEVQSDDIIVLHLSPDYKFHIPSTLHKSELQTLFSSLGVIK